ncbi:MAG: GDSL-type esterase/lipase family protein [Tannerella sp.]|jgi:lysophospholipase L1-like esterase|nr:GDSL-type esterase/lipase family protein [Tannerella sp.]
MENDRFGRLLAILLITGIAGIGMYWLPDEWMGFPIKKVDFLSDIRVKTEAPSPDTLIREPEKCDTLLTVDTVLEPGFDPDPDPDPDPVEALLPDSVYRQVAEASGMDSLPVRIEDFTFGHKGLSRFFAALNRIEIMDRPVRIAFWGDSFIEGDILVADFRARMQAYFGGRGVGFVPVSSGVEQYRPTISQYSKGWKGHSILSSRKNKYAIPGLLFEPEASEATITFKTVDAYPGLEQVSSLKFIYSRNEEAEMRLIWNDAQDTMIRVLPPSETVTQCEINGLFTNGRLRFRNAAGLQALGIALEDNDGVVVDNYSLRGNSGIALGLLDENSCLALREIRPYDLIVLQYGLNVATEKVHEYGWYREQFTEVIQHVQQCFPEADILLLGVSDRSHYHDGAFRTMPSVIALSKAQRQAAEQAQVTFWDVFRAMGGEGSMVRYVKSRWASKDYTHLSFRGGREIATALFDALILEKNLYDTMIETYD